MTRKPLFNTFQSVVVEGISLFCLFPFHLSESTRSSGVNPVVQMFMVDLVLALIVATTRFSDVWVRDLDSSPSPFPVPILFAFLYNLLFARGRSRTGELKNPCKIDGEMPSHQVSCSSPCDCPPKPAGELQGPQHQDLELGRTNSSIKAKSLPLVLVRVPGAAERRASIAVSLEVSD
jgi:hypothetical protein